MTNKKIQELTDKLSYYFDECKERDLIIGNFIGWLLNESNLVEAEVGIANGGQWQKCPKCDGQGIVSKPPWINGDQNTWAASEGSYTCNLCNGQMVTKQ